MAESGSRRSLPPRSHPNTRNKVSRFTERASARQFATEFNTTRQHDHSQPATTIKSSSSRPLEVEDVRLAQDTVVHELPSVALVKGPVSRLARNARLQRKPDKLSAPGQKSQLAGHASASIAGRVQGRVRCSAAFLKALSLPLKMSSGDWVSSSSIASFWTRFICRRASESGVGQPKGARGARAGLTTGDWRGMPAACSITSFHLGDCPNQRSSSTPSIAAKWCGGGRSALGGQSGTNGRRSARMGT